MAFSILKRVGTQSLKCSFTFTVKNIFLPEIRGLNVGDSVHVIFERGNKSVRTDDCVMEKKEQKNKTTMVVEINQALTLDVTLYRDANDHIQEKKGTLSIKQKQNKTGKSSKYNTIGVVLLNLHELVDCEAKEISMPVQYCAGEGACINLTLNSITADKDFDDNCSISTKASAVPPETETGEGKVIGHLSMKDGVWLFDEDGEECEQSEQGPGRGRDLGRNGRGEGGVDAANGKTSAAAASKPKKDDGPNRMTNSPNGKQTEIKIDKVFNGKISSTVSSKSTALKSDDSHSSNAKASLSSQGLLWHKEIDELHIKSSSLSSKGQRLQEAVDIATACAKEAALLEATQTALRSQAEAVAKRKREAGTNLLKAHSEGQAVLTEFIATKTELTLLQEELEALRHSSRLLQAKAAKQEEKIRLAAAAFNSGSSSGKRRF